MQDWCKNFFRVALLPFFFIFFIGSVYGAVPTINITSPITNNSYFDLDKITLNATSDISNTTFIYELNSINRSFTPPASIIVPTGYQSIIVYGTNGNDTGSASVDFIVLNKQDSFSSLYSIIIVIVFVFLILGFMLKDMAFKMFSGFLSSILGIYIYRNGFPLFHNNFIVNVLVIILVGLGFYLLISAPVEEYKKGES